MPKPLVTIDVDYVVGHINSADFNLEGVNPTLSSGFKKLMSNLVLTAYSVFDKPNGIAGLVYV